ncbi:hypothetical protein Arad_12384 (plasmid) [Rhizobium rhizogenes K84]|uniref:Uncharacterized protein n=1 Tax=Rhizobium rhizogenes (strain K84 / ATCC BAA-868) TaxID=311403 RepID=B9JQE5_RHIR8|nr:hypothetical protein Arad_12384 [Rhizobium rhizogenes K84]
MVRKQFVGSRRKLVLSPALQHLMMPNKRTFFCKNCPNSSLFGYLQVKIIAALHKIYLLPFQTN